MEPVKITVNYLVIELLRVGEGELVAHVGVVSHAHEVVVPRTLNKKLQSRSFTLEITKIKYIYVNTSCGVMLLA